MLTDKAVAASETTPDDVATLYSWANLRGATYRDYSASRAQVREAARKRVQEAMEAERRRAADAASIPNSDRDLRDVVTPQAPVVSPEPPKQIPEPPEQPEPVGQIDQIASSAPASVAPVSAAPAGPVLVPVGSQTGPSQHSPARWFALNNIFPANVARPENVRHRIPALAVFSLAGGVGKTSLVATLGRALAGLGERVLLVDTASFGMLPFFFGSREQKPGVLRRTFAASAQGGQEEQIELLSLDAESMGPAGTMPEPLTQEILHYGHGASRILMDLATASAGTARRILRMTPTVLIPVTPEVGSMASVGAIEAFFQQSQAQQGAGMAQPIAPYYVLSQFDEAQRLHQDVREILRGQLGNRLLPIVLRRSPAVSEALAEGMTVMDYAPSSPVAEDYARLANWVRSIAPPAESMNRGFRWSER